MSKEREKEHSFKSHPDIKKPAGIPTFRVFNTEYLSSLGEIYKCNICFNIMNNPADCDKCGHSYCYDCIANFKCPFNCQNSKTKPSSVAIKILLNQIIFKCENDGCNEKLTYNNIFLHDQECDFKPTKCPSPNCNMNISKKYLEKHIKEDCKYVYLECKVCSNEFLRLDIQEHEENCELVYDTLNNSDKSKRKSFGAGTGNKYIEALNINIAKIIKEQEEKFKNLKEENSKMKNDVASSVADVLIKMKDELKESDSKKITNTPTQNFDEKKLIENLTQILQKNLNDVLIMKIKKMLENNAESIKEYFERINNTKGFEDMPNQFSSFDDDKKQKGQDNNGNGNINSSNTQFDEEFASLIVNALKLSQDNIISSISESKDNLLEEIKFVRNKFDDLNLFNIRIEQKLVEINNSKEIPIPKNEVKENSLLEEKINKVFQDFNLKLSEIVESIKNVNSNLSSIQLNSQPQISDQNITIQDDSISQAEESEEKQKIDIDKLTSHFIKNVIEIVEDKNESFLELFNKEIQSLSTNLTSQYDKFSDELENLKIETLNPIEKKTKDLNKIISEEFEECNNKISEANEKIENNSRLLTEIKEVQTCMCNKINNFDRELNKIIEQKLLQQYDKLTQDRKSDLDLIISKQNEHHEEKLNFLKNHLEKLSNQETSEKNNKHDLELYENNQNFLLTLSEIKSSLTDITSSFDTKLQNLELRLTSNMDTRLKEMYNLKWCNECEKVDYFFGFIKCEICMKETCKQCVLLCKSCRKLYCKKCVKCSKCGDLSCLNCRLPCSFCSITKGDKFCFSCIKECQHCKKATCQECIKQCISCKNMSCEECSKFCRICNKSSCVRCETSKNFKLCYACQKTSCIECVVTCSMCELEICKTCFMLCKRCKKLICRKCGVDCAMCSDSYCGNCSKEFGQNKCSICKKHFCTICVKNFKKCKVCKESACKDCQSQCKKCKNYFCNNCSLNCDNCNDFTCSTCVYKCVCDLLIFCEKCLLDSNPIGPHNCVLWMNDSPDFTGIKSRSKLPLPRNFEAKVYLEKFHSENLLVGITDNNTFNEDSISFVDNIWCFKARTGQKYSTKNSLQPYYEKETRERDFIIIAVKNDNLYFRVNFDENPPAFQLPPNKSYYLYVENDSGNTLEGGVKVKFVYIRKI
jgi:hypothetical protein